MIFLDSYQVEYNARPDFAKEKNKLFFIKSFQEHHLDLDQASHYVGPDLGPTSLQKLSADDTSNLHAHRPFP